MGNLELDHLILEFIRRLESVPARFSEAFFSYVPIALLKHHDQRPLTEERVYLGLMVLAISIHDGGVGVEGSWWLEQQLRAHILNCKWE